MRGGKREDELKRDRVVDRDRRLKRDGDEIEIETRSLWRLKRDDLLFLIKLQ